MFYRVCFNVCGFPSPCLFVFAGVAVSSTTVATTIQHQILELPPVDAQCRVLRLIYTSMVFFWVPEISENKLFFTWEGRKELGSQRKEERWNQTLCRLLGCPLFSVQPQVGVQGCSEFRF